MQIKGYKTIGAILCAIVCFFAIGGVTFAWTAPSLAPPGGVPAAPHVPGTIKMYGGSSAPSGWLLCNGQSVPQASYPALYAAIGTTYGGGGGNFTLPDLRGRIPMGAGGSYALGSTGGAETVNIAHAHTVNAHVHSTAGHVLTGNEMPSHTHPVNDPGHSHTVTIWHRHAEDAASVAFREAPPVVARPFGTSANGTGVSFQSAGANWAHDHGNTGNETSATDSQLSGTQPVMNPYQAVNYIIKF